MRDGLFGEPHELRNRQIGLLPLLDERRHLVVCDVEDLDALLGHLAAKIGVAIDLVEHVGNALAQVLRRRLRHARAAIAPVDPIDADLTEGRRVRQVRKALRRGDDERARLAFLRDRERRIRHGAVDMSSEERRGEVPGSLERDVGRLDAGVVIQPLVRGVVRGIGAGPGHVELSGIRLRRRDEVLVGLERRLAAHDDRDGRVVEEDDVGDIVGLVLDVALERLQHEVRHVGAHDRIAVAGKAVELRPRERAAGARLRLDHELLAPFLAPDLLLQPRRDVGFAARSERDDVAHGLLRIGRARRERHRGRNRAARDQEITSLHTASAMALPTSMVFALPPMSRVRGPSTSTFSIAFTMASAASLSPRCSSIIAPDQICPIGLAIPLPKMSGALPCTGSKHEGNSRSGLRFADGAIPIVPVQAGPRSDRMSPKRFEPTTTSNQSGCWTKCAVRMSMWYWLVFPPADSAANALEGSAQYGIVIAIPFDFVAEVTCLRARGFASSKAKRRMRSTPLRVKTESWVTNSWSVPS